MSKKVYVAMSGGVDSSVAAALLQRQGYDVTGVYMKNWSQDLPGFTCPWKEDFQDAKRAAVHLGINFILYDFETEYRQRVVDYMVKAYQEGLTPNPDIMCNQEVKFKLFLETALQEGADYIATGHYAAIDYAKSKSGANGVAKLLTAKDDNKDHTYFLYRVTSGALGKTIFPLADLTKPEVRQLAKKFGFANAEKKESMGICFVGKVGIKEFLINELGEQVPGDIVDQNAQVVGQHDGAIFYTIGQRRGLNVGGGLPYYIIGKNMAKNQVIVSTNLDNKALWQNDVIITQPHWIGREPLSNQAKKDELYLRTRHRAPLVLIKSLKRLDNGNLQIILEHPERAVTPGQSAVIYQKTNHKSSGKNHNLMPVLGGGIII